MIDFANVEDCVSFLDRVSSLDDVRAYKLQSIGLLILCGRPIEFLDVGCGTGEDAVEMARRLEGGEVVGADFSREMVAEAERRAKGLSLPIRFQQADIHDLPFDDHSFDAVRIDRVLHFLPDPGMAMAEIVRVTAPGGRVVVAEPDWCSLLVEGGDQDLDRRVRAFISAQPGTDTGSVLPALFEAAGLQVIAFHKGVFETRGVGLAADLFDLEVVATRALQARALNLDEALSWLRALQYAGERGSFHASLWAAWQPALVLPKQPVCEWAMI